MLHSSFISKSNGTKFPSFASANATLSSFRASSHFQMGLKWSKIAFSSSSGQRLSSKARSRVKHRTANVYGRQARERVLEEEASEMAEATPSFKIFPGQAFPLGASEVDNGINFAIFSQHATAVTLCLSLPQRGELDMLAGGMIEFSLDPNLNKTGDIWHICIEDLPRSNVLYGYRIDGPKDWDKGHRFDSNNILIDPYAKLVEGRRNFGDAKHKLSKFLGTYDFDSLPFDWGEDYKLPNIPERDLVVYEMNVRAFTADESSCLDQDIRGTYAGLIEKIPHLLELGINAVELLPVFEFDEFEFQRRPNPRDHMINTWGYSTINFFAPMSRYGSGGGGAVSASREFKEMVKALHGAGIEVILDVVYNHTNEADDKHPYTTSFRGIDNKVYYMVDLNNEGQLLNFSGCGNTFNCNHPVVMELILDSLRNWVVEYHIDGFRFDLASVLCRGTDGSPLGAPPLIRAIAKDATLSRCKIIAEPWDCGGLYLVGSFPNWDRWAEWNGKYRDDLRRFIKGDPGMKGAFATRVSGSADLYRKNKRKPYHSVNFVIAHDGFTLRDLVSYNFKHNEANGEGGNDPHCFHYTISEEMASADSNLLILNFLTLASLSLFYADKAFCIRIPDRASTTPRELSDQSLKTAVFALGSFWRSEAVFGCLNGVVRTTSGYAGGSKINPEYRSLGDHAESVMVEYDPKEINFRQLLEVFWSSHDPRQVFGQGPDVGPQYRSIIFTNGTEEARLAAMSKEREQTKSRSSILTTQIQQLESFYPAEPEHQKFELKRHPMLLQLIGNLPEDELEVSNLAAKLNGYAAELCPQRIQKQIDAKINGIIRRGWPVLRDV